MHSPKGKKQWHTHHSQPWNTHETRLLRPELNCCIMWMWEEIKSLVGKGLSQAVLPVVFALLSHAGLDLWHRSLKVGDWSHRALPIRAPPLTLTSDTVGLSSVTAFASVSIQAADTDPVLTDRALFLSPFIDPLNNLSLLIFPDKLFPLLLTFPVTTQRSFCFCLRSLWHCGLWGSDSFGTCTSYFCITVFHNHILNIQHLSAIVIVSVNWPVVPKWKLFFFVIKWAELVK